MSLQRLPHQGRWAGLGLSQPHDRAPDHQDSQTHGCRPGSLGRAPSRPRQGGQVVWLARWLKLDERQGPLLQRVSLQSLSQRAVQVRSAGEVGDGFGIGFQPTREPDLLVGRKIAVQPPVDQFSIRFAHGRPASLANCFSMHCDRRSRIRNSVTRTAPAVDCTAVANSATEASSA